MSSVRAEIDQARAEGYRRGRDEASEIAFHRGKTAGAASSARTIDQLRIRVAQLLAQRQALADRIEVLNAAAVTRPPKRRRKP